ncbi:MAG: ATP-binding cassette domain-containing protein [Paludibacter sp.]|nr:ATP-binding cassette domain-containing protein [Paludibacter sp.]
MSNLLEIDSVVKSYGLYDVLTDIYLKCKTGDIIGMLGRNGTGKSTLMKILFGTLQADRKFIRIDGKVYDQPYKAINEICYLPQDSFLPKYMSVEKTSELYLGKQQVANFLEDSILQKLNTSKISYLSGGELRYLEIKLLLHTDCKFILLDEPFNGVSPILVGEIKKLILKTSESKGIILTDHDYRNVLDVANQFCLIYDGGIKRIHDKQELVRWGYISESSID